MLRNSSFVLAVAFVQVLFYVSLLLSVFCSVLSRIPRGTHCLGSGGFASSDTLSRTFRASFLATTSCRYNCLCHGARCGGLGWRTASWSPTDLARLELCETLRKGERLRIPSTPIRLAEHCDAYIPFSFWWRSFRSISVSLRDDVRRAQLLTTGFDLLLYTVAPRYQQPTRPAAKCVLGLIFRLEVVMQQQV